MRKLILFILLLSAPLAAMDSFTLESEESAIGYDVIIEGVDDPEALKLLYEESELIKLQHAVPDTRFGLRRRADDDLPIFINALHSLAYYNARIHMDIDMNTTPPRVVVKVDLGPKYLLSDFVVTFADGSCIDAELPAALGICPGTPALPKDILRSEEELIFLLASEGYPFAEILSREYIADQSCKTLRVVLTVEPGPVGYFGPTCIVGNTRTKHRFFTKRIRWQEGGRYNTRIVQRTRDYLEDSGLFSSVNISLGEIEDSGLIPMEISVIEAKQRTFGFGVSYTTQLGPGAAVEWEHRNFRGIGEIVSLNVNLWERLREANIAYTIPHFLSRRQDLIWLADVEEDITKGYTARAASLSSTLLRRLNQFSQISYTAMIKVLKDTRSDNNRNFTLFKTPIQYRWSNADSLLDPRHGVSFDLRTSPSTQIFSPSFYYQTNQAIISAYYPWSESTTFAGKAVFGSIIGSPNITIPPSERFYAGTDSLLRGYQYKTVSPLDAENDPIGGRSMMIYSFELRKQVSENWGWVGFYEFGNVYSQVYPPFGQRMLHSTGIGLRYYTPVGPIRADFAFPLNPRKDIDKVMQFYISVGQTF